MKTKWPMNHNWSREDIATLRKHWGTLTPREIAAMIGVTRNAVIGKAHRLKLPPYKPHVVAANLSKFWSERWGQKREEAAS